MLDLGQHDGANAGATDEPQVGVEPGSSGVVDAHQHALADIRLSVEPRADIFTRQRLVVRRNGVLEIDDDRVGAGRKRLAEAIRAIAGNEEIAERRFHGNAFMRRFSCKVHTACAARSSAISGSEQPSSARMASVCSPSAGTGSMRADASSATWDEPGGSNAGMEPAGDPTSRHAFRARNCASSQTSCMSLTRALAI